MITRRQLLAGLSGATAWLAISACTDQGDAPASSNRNGLAARLTNPTANDAPAMDAASASTAPTPFPYHGVEIEFRTTRLSPASQEAFLNEIAKFKLLTGITVTPEFSEPNVFYKGGQEFGPQTAPDIWAGGPQILPPLAVTGHVLDLSDYVDAWDQWEDFYTTARQDVVFAGSVLGIPYRTNYRGSMVIRASQFRAAGLSAVPPATWAELNEITPKLTVRDGEVIEQAGINILHDTQAYEDWLVQAGGSAFDANLAQPSNNSGPGQAALYQHVRHGLFDRTMPVGGMNSGIPSLHAFCAGNVAIQPLWPGNVHNCQTDAPAVFDDLLIGPPLEGPSQRVLQLYVDKFMAWKSTRHPDAVFETIKYFASPGPNYEVHYVHEASMPCRKAMERLGRLESEPWRSLAENVKYGRNRQIVPNHFYVQPAMSRWVEAAAMGKLSVEDALAGMDEEVLPLLPGR